jgi:DNA gyrase subunit A
VLGRFHPHGDASVYMALVRMAQPFSMGLMLVDGQGNFGSVDGDMPASMRYTEARMAPGRRGAAGRYRQGHRRFPAELRREGAGADVLPSRIPNLLVNGAGGIAVGMATNIPPHNLGEIVDACRGAAGRSEYLRRRAAGHRSRPRLPDRRRDHGPHRAAQCAARRPRLGHVRGKASIETIRKDREAIVVTELPYQVNKADPDRAHRRNGAREADRGHLRRPRRIRPRGHADGDRAEARRVGRRDPEPAVSLHRHADVVRRQHAGPEPRPSRADGPAPSCSEAFLEFREEVVVRRTKFELAKARDRGHVLVGLAVAVANIDEVIHIIRSSADPAEARERLQAKQPGRSAT